jgi:hypothetical protein
MSVVAKQSKYRQVSVAKLMLEPSFLRGVEDYRAGNCPNFEDGNWGYERGRQWAASAPSHISPAPGKRNSLAQLIFMMDVCPDS